MCFHGAFRGRVLCPRVCTAPSCSIKTDPEIAVESKPKSREGRSRGGGHRDSRPFLLFSADIDGGLGERRRGSVGFEEWGREPWRMMRYWKDRSRFEAIRGFRWKSTRSRVRSYRRYCAEIEYLWLVIIWEEMIILSSLRPTKRMKM